MAEALPARPATSARPVGWRPTASRSSGSRSPSTAARRSCVASTCRSRPGARSRCWARAAAARRRCCGSSPGSRSPTEGSCGRRQGVTAPGSSAGEAPHRHGVPGLGAVPHLSVARNVGLRAPAAERRLARIDEALGMVGLAGMGDRCPRPCRAASNSVSRSPGRSPHAPGPAARRAVLEPRRTLGSRSAPRSTSCWSSWASPRSSSPTTRTRRSSWATAWRCSPRRGRAVRLPRRCTCARTRWLADFVGRRTSSLVGQGDLR